MKARLKSLTRKLGLKQRSPLSAARAALNYLLYKADIRQSPFAAHDPLLLQIEPTSRCNLRCSMCMRDKVDARIGDMEVEDFRRLLNKTSGLLRVHLQGNGEPFLHPDILEFIGEAAGRGLYVTTITNGTRITDELARGVISAGLSEMQFSVDSLEEEEFERLRVGASLPTVVENIQRTIRIRNETGADMQVSIAVVVQRSNRERLQDYIRFCEELGSDKISMQCLEPKHEGRYADGFLARHTPFEDREALHSRLREAQELAREKGIEFDFVSQRAHGCRWPWDGLYVTWEGDVTPCCLIFDHFVGNAFKGDIRRIWNGRKMRDFRRKLRTVHPPPQCTGCSHYRQWKF